MKYSSLISALFIISSKWILAQAAPTNSWTGGFWQDGSWVAVNLRLNGSTATADIIFPTYGGAQNAINVDVAALKQSSSDLHFEIPVRSGHVVFDGRMKGDTLAGRYAFGKASGSFGMTRVANVTLSDLEKYYGAYRVAPDRVISILRGWSYTRTLNYVDYKTGQVGTLWPSSATEFFSGDGLAVNYPVTIRLAFGRDTAGNGTSLIWRSKTGTEFRARRIEAKEERVIFKNGDISLGGTLILPPTPGRHAAIIITPGDYGTNRNQLRLWAHHYVSHGVAALIFDARGGGESTGPVGASSFSDLANDVLAGVQLLKARDDINPKQIGLFGFSNSTFTVTLAASRSQDVAFLILQSLVGVVAWKQEVFRAETQLRVDHFPEEIVKRGAEFMKLKFEVARTGQGWDRLQSIMDQARNEAWLPYTNPPSSLERIRQSYRGTMSYDPVPALEKLRIPILALWGDKDTYVPVPESVAAFKRAMMKAGNSWYVIKVFPRANHSLIEHDTGSPSTGGSEKRFVPAAWKLEADWLTSILRLGRS